MLGEHMPIPGYQDFMKPLLKIASDGQEHCIDEAMDTLAIQMGIDGPDRDEQLPSGTQTRFYNRVTWAITYLTKTLLMNKCGRGRFTLAPRGAEILKENPSRVDNKYLERFPEYQT